MRNSKNNKGFSLLEVLIAVVVFSFGLLGIAGMMTISVKNNHNGYLRSQANFFAENMADRMRANPAALWAGAYSGTASTGTSVCDLASPCTLAQLAAFDMESWANSIDNVMPSGEGSIACINNQVLPGTVVLADAPSIWSAVPPFAGTCTITVTWNESNRFQTSEAQSVVLVIQP